MGPPRSRRVKNFVKKGRGGSEESKMNEQLAVLGLKVVPVTGDGNCFFRAIADQLEGNEDGHHKYRSLVVDFLEEHREDFEPFLGEETTFDEYCIDMRQDGTWAGHTELQATSLVTKCDICIHRVMFPRWQIMNFQSPGTRVLQLSYHGEEHYNSVRKLNDNGVGPPTLDTVKVDANLINDLPPPKDGYKSGLTGQRKNTIDVAAIKQVLDDVHGDLDAAVEYLVAERNQSSESDSSSDLISLDGSGTSSEQQLRTFLQPEPETSLLDADTGISESSIGTEVANMVSKTKNVLLHPAQAVSRNKRCPCGSKKKYKACCGAVHTKPGVTVLTSSHEGVLSNRARKEKARASKATSSVMGSLETSTDFIESDLGALCI